MKVEYLSPGELFPYPQNAKIHTPDQVKRIANSIKEFGFQQPIVIDKDNVVIIGHGRLFAAQELHLDSVPVVRADDLTEDQAKALRLADNKLNESPYDFSKLEEELAALDIAGFDMKQFGFVDSEPGVSEPKEVSLDEKYQLIIDCESEADMQEKYDALQEVGIECRVSTL
jgi:ParB-like chromosome segregation protein Spo0J